MADFRRVLTVLAVLAVMTGVASAQVGGSVPGGSANNALICTATGAGIPELRPEGYTELVGDILITCTGGPVLAPTAAVPTTNITIYMSPSVPITSRYLTTAGASDALLIIDEAGSSVTTAVSGFGPEAKQTLCTNAQQQAVGGSVCSAFVGLATGKDGLPYDVAVTGISGTAATTPAQNVYQGKIGDFGANTVTFYNVPVLPPATTGVTRVFRITNIRVPVPGGNLSGTLQAVVSTSPNQTLPVAGTAINNDVVGPGMTAAVKANKTAFQQCQPQVVQLTAQLVFTEGFATGFKTRVVPGGAANNIPGNNKGNTTWAAEAINDGSINGNNQNIPGGLYGNFAANSESGFIYPGLTGTIGSFTYTAGLADYGTRLKAVFQNIPAGLTLYVSTTSATVSSNSTTAGAFVPGGTSLFPYAVLVATNSGEATADAVPFKPITSTTAGNNGVVNGVPTPDGLQAIALATNSATNDATAVWEVTNANPSAQDVLVFSVYVSYTATSSTATNPYGLPITDLPLNSPLNNVQLSLAPEPSHNPFSTAQGPQGVTDIIPRFAVIKTQEGRFVAINLCQTTLLYPYVTGAAGFDTGIAVANTSWDPFGTVNQTGSCKLYGYGVTVAAAGNTAAQPVVSGCDFISNPLPGTNCFPIVPAGQVMSVLASTTQLANFQGYVIAVCNFQYAHGYAAVTDLGLRNLWSSYLALELNNAVGTPRVGVAGIEALVH